jgi:hypothetical protein
LERLLRMAVTERGSEPNPIAPRVVVPLLGMAMTYAGDELIDEYLTPQPGAGATYEVRCRGAVDGEQTILSDDLNAAAALRLAVRYGRDGIGGINLVGRTADGIERRAINRTTDGVLEYLFPSAEAYDGPDEAVGVALQAWAETIQRWRADFEVPGGGPAWPAAPQSPAIGEPSRGRPEGPRSSQGSAHGSSQGGPQGGDRIPTAAEIADAIQSSLMQMTVDINLTEVETLIRRTITTSFGELKESAPSTEGPGGPWQGPAGPGGPWKGLGTGPRGWPGPDIAAATPALPAVGAEPADAPIALEPDQLAELTAALVVERIAPLLPSSDEAVAEQIAAMVAFQIDAFLRANAFGAGLEETLEQVEPLLNEISATQEQVLAGAASLVGFESRILGAVEQLSLQVQELREQARTSIGAMQSLTDQVAALTRRSEAVGERVTTTVGQELDQFSDRMRHQLDKIEALAKRTGGDAAAPDGVTRLTSKLTRSDAQIERLLRRLDDFEPTAPRQTPA